MRIGSYLARQLVPVWLAVAAFTGATASSTADTLIENVSVLPMTGIGLQHGYAVRVDGDRIVAVGPAATMTAGPSTERIDGGNGVLMPGLVDMHVHIGNPENVQGVADELALFVAYGITTVRVMWGQPLQLPLRDAIVRERRFAPSLVLSGEGFRGFHANKSPAELAQLVQQQVEAGWDLIKAHEDLPQAQFDAILAAAKRLGIPVSGHVPDGVSLSHVLASGIAAIEHIEGYVEELGGLGAPVSDAAIRDVAAQTKAAGVAIAPTMFGWSSHLGYGTLEQWLRLPELAYMPSPVVEQWRKSRELSTLGQARAWAEALVGWRDPAIIVANRERLLKGLGDAGVTILFSTDARQAFTVPGFSALREMRAMQAAGLGNRQILESATRVAGAFLKRIDRIGTIEPGARADLVLLAQNPIVSQDVV